MVKSFQEAVYRAQLPPRIQQLKKVTVRGGAFATNGVKRAQLRRCKRRMVCSDALLYVPVSKSVALSSEATVPGPRLGWIRSRGV